MIKQHLQWLYSTLCKSFLMAAFVIPTTSSKGWDTDKYKKIAGNKIDFSDKGIEISVDKSASPLIYSLGKVTQLKSFNISGEFIGLPDFKDVQKQGQKHFDDYPLRLGFIRPGDKTLTGPKSWFAADWVKKLFAKAPKGSGISGITFFNVTQNKNLLNTQRVHPLSDLLEERFIHLVTEPGKFNIEYQLKQPMDVAAIWISIDGDDTKSKFQVNIESLVLDVQDAPK